MNDTNNIKTTDQGSVITVFLTFLRLGLTSFGGPVAHLGYFRDEFVVHRKWLDERAYADLVALCQFLPGPASSQVGIAVGLSRAGLPGAVAAWIAFTAPSAIALSLFGYGVVAFGDEVGLGALHGLKVVAVAVVAQAVWGMAQKLCPDAKRASLAVLATIGVLAVPSPFVQVGAIVVGGILGWTLLRAEAPTDHVDLGVHLPRFISITALLLFFAGLIGLPLLAMAYPFQTMALVDSFYRSGSLVFGGGHVVMPLLQAEVVPSGWVSKDAFLAGYGAAQAVPGPLFTFAAFLGTVMTGAPTGVFGGLICLLAILSASDFGLALAAFILLVFWKTPAWLVVILTGLGGWALHTGVIL
jgi:chromate transporter